MTALKVGLLGCGEMGGALIRGVAKSVDSGNVILFNRTPEKAEKLASEINAFIAKQENDLIKANCDYILLAVKPYVIKSAIENLFTGIDSYSGTIVSVAAGVSLQDLEDCIPEQHKKTVSVIRLMPNTPCHVGEGMIGLSALENVSKDKVDELSMLLKKAGVVEQVTEPLLDAVTALSGSGVAYGFMFIEALADAGVQFGMTRKQAYVFSAQMLKGAGAMVLETGIHPGVLKDGVCSPGGITIKALDTLEEKGFRGTVIAAAKKAFEVSRSFGK